MKKVLRSIARKLKRVSPFLFYVAKYKKASRKIRGTYNVPSADDKRQQLFESFLARNNDERSLQIGVKEAIGEKFGPNWVSVDKYDEREFIDYQYDIHELKFEDNSFSAVVCWSILEHVPYPQKAIAELYRVLKPGGEIWVQLPFLFPYHEAPEDYWRVTPDGLRIWMEAFNESGCGCDFWDRTSLISATYYYGTK